VRGQVGEGVLVMVNWVEIGPCKLACGDCLEILPTLENESVDAVVTDPPYGIDFQSSRRGRSQRFEKIENDTQPFVWWCWFAFKIVKNGGCVLCFCRWDDADAFRQSLEWALFRVASQCIWDRGSHGMGDLSGSPGPRHDTIWFATKGRFMFHGKRPVSVLSHMRLPGSDLIHPNEKPCSLMEELCGDYCQRDGVILDPFMGSGTTGVACIRTGRKFIGIEKEPKYFEIACKRIEREWLLKKSELPFEKPAKETQKELY